METPHLHAANETTVGKLLGVQVNQIVLITVLFPLVAWPATQEPKEPRVLPQEQTFVVPTRMQRASLPTAIASDADRAEASFPGDLAA